MQADLLINYTIYTDGGARANGKDNAAASFAFVVTKKVANAPTIMHEEYGKVPEILSIKPSNNRGELFGIWNAIKYIYDNKLSSVVAIVSDSEYCIKTLTQYAPKWIAESNFTDKKNLDIILPAVRMLDLIKTLCITVKFFHIRSHKTAPKVGGADYTDWYYNDYVDKLTQLPFTK